MTELTESLRTYVRAALELQGYRFTDARIAEITLQFARFESIARTILPDADLPDASNAGTAAVFRP